MNTLREKIGEIPIFFGLTQEDLAKLLGKMEECSFSAGTIIFSQGDPSDGFYFIDSGAVQLTFKGATEKPEAITLLGPGKSFGQRAMVTGEFRSASVTTVEETVLWKLSRDVWNEVVKPQLS